MFLKLYFLLHLFVNLSLGEGIINKLPNLLEDNFDLEILKSFLKVKNTTASLDLGGTNTGNFSFTYDDIATIEHESNKEYSTKQGYGETVKHFYLYTRDFRQGSTFELIDPKNISSIKYCHFQTRPTYILIHGFIGYGLENWIITMKNKLLKSEDCNVMSVDWPAGEEWFLPTYISAAKRVATVGNETAKLMESFVDMKGLHLEDVHCIGHSLGGHVCGFAGKPFQGRVGRISGLDPAGPLFHNVSAAKRLDKKDAVYVDVIHTNACTRWPYWTDCYGLNQDVGHSNFYPNGGKHQPHCTGKIRGDIGCDHMMAYKYYIYSLDFSPRGTYFLSRPCDDWVMFEIGNCSCGKNAQFLGFNVNTEVEGKFYLETRSEPPYAMEDPDCSTWRQWNVLIIIGYVIVVALVTCCVCSVCLLVVENIRRTCCGPFPRDDEDSLFSDSSDDDDGSDDSDEDEEREENHTVTIAVVSSAELMK